MAHMWPDGVSSNLDMRFFCQMMVGEAKMNSAFDIHERMPSARPDCFLTFIPGGCGDCTSLAVLRACVPDLMAELKSKAHDPSVAVRTGAVNADSWYDHGQLSKSNCTCRLNFGGEGRVRTRKTQIVDCQGLAAGRKFEAGLMHAIRANNQADQERDPVYFDKAFHALLNDNDHRKLHRIAAHSDKFLGSYVSQDPITSLSWGCAGVHVLSPAAKKPGVTHLIVSRHGDVTVMGGEFQQHFLHAVPPVSEWSDLLEAHRHELLDWEIEAM